MRTTRRRWRTSALITIGAAATLTVGLSVAAAGPAQAAPARLVFSLSNANAAGGVAYRMTFGPVAEEVPVVGNWDQAVSGRDTIGLSQVVGTTRRWALAAGNSTLGTAAKYDFQWGSAACLPVSGNWQGLGDTVGQACADRTTNTWRWSLAGPLPISGPLVTFRTYSFGSTACQPITGDWNGDGITTVGVSCPNGAGRTWRLTDSPGNGTQNPPASIQFGWGAARCVPVTGDWDGLATNRSNGVTVGQACPSTGDLWNWNLSNHNSAGAVNISFTWGSSREVPIAGDWDGLATAAHTNNDTPGTVAGVNYPAVAAPAPNPQAARNVTTGWSPRTQYVVDQARLRFALSSCGGQATGTSSGHIPGSDHYTGNAADCFPDGGGVIVTGAAKQLGDNVAAWLVGYGSILRVKYVIWYGYIYDFQTSSPSWQPYCNGALTAAQCAHPTAGTVATLQHYDHVHISLLH